MKLSLVLFSSLLALATSTVYFKDTFEDGEAWSDRWVQSTKRSDYGAFKLSAGKFYGDAEKDKGMQTSENAKFYARTAKFEETFDNEGKTFVVQFSVKHEQKIDCGGGYVKIFPSTLDPKEMEGESKYNIMFGPDICGPGTKKVHVIFNYKDKNLLIKRDVTCKDDEFTHLYTLIVRPDNTYVVKIDNKEAQSGSLEDDWDFLPPKKINDPDAKKPDDWVDNPKMDDPEDTKPEDWDKPEYIPDPDAEKPEDWDDETDGEWEPPSISNPEYKGTWKPRQIDNPDYKGEWEHPQIDNPEYSPDDKLYLYKDSGYIGFDLWQVKSGTIFDNVLITDDEDLASQFAEETFTVTQDGEKKMKEKQDEEERKAREEAEKKRKEEEEAEGDEDDDEDLDEDDEDDDYEDDASDDDSQRDEL